MSQCINVFRPDLTLTWSRCTTMFSKPWENRTHNQNFAKINFALGKYLSGLVTTVNTPRPQRSRSNVWSDQNTNVTITKSGIPYWLNHKSLLCKDFCCAHYKLNYYQLIGITMYETLRQTTRIALGTPGLHCLRAISTKDRCDRYFTHTQIIDHRCRLSSEIYYHVCM